MNREEEPRTSTFLPFPSFVVATWFRLSSWANTGGWFGWYWRRYISHLKRLRNIPDRNMVGFIMEMLSNQSFVVHTSEGQRSRLRIMKNGVPHGSVLSPMLFSIYISDLPETTSIASTVMLTICSSYCDAHLGRKWKRVSTKT